MKIRVEVAASPYYWATHPDPKDWPYREVEIAEGWRRVFTGGLKVGDLFLDMVQIRENNIVWLPVEPADRAQDYECVIRHEPPEQSPEHVCERCLMKGAVRGNKYCPDCTEIVRKEIRRKRK